MLDRIEQELGTHRRLGERVAVEDPSWLNFWDLLVKPGLSVESVHVDDDMAREVGRNVRNVVFSSRVQNVTGRMLIRRSCRCTT
ncbi:hypothetical protein [Mycobacterium leprae]|uniref:hypothetical protein n=1 Tax=Mycobacterium leprae TaxID=1769 RepID=UPI000A422B14|nr:hypothetical protein [Mycobacterium leprae]